MSFIDPELPEGARFLGVVVVSDVVGPEQALRKIDQWGINPGGESLAVILPVSGIGIREGDYNKLLTEDDLINYDEPSK